MKYLVTLLALVLCFNTGFSQEQKKQKKNFSFAVDIKHNSAAGFYPVFLGNLELNPTMDLTVYSIFWTNPNFGTPSTGGNLLLETGVGVAFKLLDKKLYLNPSLGIANGKFLAGGSETLLGEGLVPNVFTLYNHGKFEFEGYVAYYKSIRKGEDRSGIPAVNRDYFLNWLVPGYKINDNFSVGGYYEQFIASRASQDALTGSLYQWVGGYVKHTWGNKYSIRLAAGANVSNDAFGVGKEFYKANVFIPLN